MDEKFMVFRGEKFKAVDRIDPKFLPCRGCHFNNDEDNCLTDSFEKAEGEYGQDCTKTQTRYVRAE